MHELIQEIQLYLNKNHITLREDLKNWNELINEYTCINKIILSYLDMAGIKEKNYSKVYEYIFKRIKVNKLDVLKNEEAKFKDISFRYGKIEEIDHNISHLNSVNNSTDELYLLLENIYIESLINLKINPNIEIKNSKQIIYNWLFKRKFIRKENHIVVKNIDRFFWYKKKVLYYLINETTGKLIQRDNEDYATDLDIHLDNQQKKAYLNSNKFDKIIDHLSISVYLEELIEKCLKKQEKQVLHLLFWKKKTHEQISKIIKKDPRTVRSNKNRALLKLKVALINDFNNIKNNYADTYLYTILKRQRNE